MLSRTGVPTSTVYRALSFAVSLVLYMDGCPSVPLRSVQITNLGLFSNPFTFQPIRLYPNMAFS